LADIALVFDGPNLRGDFALGPTDIVTGDELQTAVMISLFTDPGWWANAYLPDPWGCRLLELRRAKRTNATLQKARDYCRLALQWLIDDGVAQSVDVQAEWQGSLLEIAVTVAQATGTTSYSFVWNDV
jgi:phage gp46-like protein